MNLKTRDVLIFWRDTPVDVEKGAFDYISRKWGNKVIIICFNNFEEERKQANWEDDEFKETETIILNNIEDKPKFTRELFDKYPNAIHIFSGFRGEKQKVLRKYIARSNNYKLGIIAERPYLYGSKFVILLKKVAFFCLYTYYNIIFGKYVKVFLAMGEIGVKTYREYGWEKKILFPFMYNPRLAKIKNENKFKNEVVKFLYIGRFDANAKGLDVLIKAVNSIKKKNWHLDIVGGYGSIKDIAIDWANNHPNVNFKGTWNTNEVCEKMKNYDACIVPSKYDGWNLTPNQAINVGIGTIITDQAGSDELIIASGAGVVVPANNVGALAKAIQFAIDNPGVVAEWKRNAQYYSSRISSEVVGKYFIDIMDYTFNYNTIDRPVCPWL